MNLKTVSAMKWRLLFPAIAAALILGFALFWFLREPEAPKGRKTAPQPAHRMQIEGLRFYGMNQGRRVVSITADRFSLRRGKIGFFSTGLTRTALIENAVIDVYAGKKGGTAPDSFHADDAAQNRERSPLFAAGNIDFGGLFAEETFSTLFPVRNVAEIEITPVTVRLHADQAVLTGIVAARASVRLQEKEILFTGNVRVSSGGAELTTEQLTFLSGSSRLRTDRPFVLKQGNRTLEGAGLTTDIFLRPL
jgi:hypothetical protein